MVNASHASLKIMGLIPGLGNVLPMIACDLKVKKPLIRHLITTRIEPNVLKFMHYVHSLPVI